MPIGVRVALARIKGRLRTADDQGMPPSDDGPSGFDHVRGIARQLLPGVVLPGLIYFLTRPHIGVIPALAAASCVPALDAVARLLRGGRPSAVGLVFVAATGLSVALAMSLHSALFILVKGAVISVVLGVAVATSAALGRPLTRWLALRLSSEHQEHRARLAERWGHPRAVRVFRVLSVAWGILLVGVGIQQGLLVMTVSPGFVMAVEGPVQLCATLLGVLASVIYVRRIQRLHPEIGMLPARAA